MIHFRDRCSMLRSKLFLFVLPMGLLALSSFSNAQGIEASYVGLCSSLQHSDNTPVHQPLSMDEPSERKSSASISGSVVDQSDAPVVNARITLVGPDDRGGRVTLSGAEGRYRFDGLPAGSFRIRVRSHGFAVFTSEPAGLVDRQDYLVPKAVLLVATASTEVNVKENDPRVADEQIRAEEKQRLFGLVPNFYTSFVPDAASLNTRQKYSLALRDTLDPTRFVGTAVGAIIQQANNTYPGYGKGAAGYGKRYAALYGDGLIGDVLSHAVFPSLLHQDPRYFYQGTGSFKSRFGHAISFAVVTRNDKGQTVPNYSYLLADLGSGALSNLYYPHADRGVGLVFINAAIGFGGRAAGSLVREFIWARFTTHVPARVNP